MFLRQIHLELCKVSKIVCTILGVQIALEIGVIIMFITGTFYNLFIRYIMNQQKVKGLPAQTCIIISMCFLNIVKAISLNYASKNATNEVIYLAHHCLIKDFDKITFTCRETEPLKSFTRFMIAM